MKKLMFTAIALVAFSSASMANTIAHEEVVSEKSQITNKIAITSIENLNVLELYTQYKLTAPVVKTDSIKDDCDDYVEHLMELIEEVFGCMDSGAYNNLVYQLYYYCRH